ncbi:MAG TPA: hypothetical protein VD735_07640 [Candidatus Saccharimonadales bacterium]|nr:hypothetical protein [Candidatus Saccharimonadales bacterium]
MKSVLVHIKEKDKGSRNLSLFNLKEEVVNFLYKDTLANATKSDLQFFVLLHFIILPTAKDKTFLESILDEALPKFNALNRTFQKKQGYLRANEYHQRVEEHDLSEIFKYDVFFILIEAILRIDDIEHQFTDFINSDPQLKLAIKRIKSEYQPTLSASLEMFQASKIEDDRYDDDGNYHDLSKSVYRTVKMRNARNLELNLQRYTSVKKITSNSPVSLDFLQHIDPQIIFDLWDKYHVADYMKGALKTAGDITSNVIAGVMTQLVLDYRRHRNINGAKDRKLKKAAKKAFDKSQAEEAERLQQLNLRLVDSILKSQEILIKEVQELRREKRELEEKNMGAQNDEIIKKLNDRIARLENLEVEAELVDDEKNQKDSDKDIQQTPETA